MQKGEWEMAVSIRDIALWPILVTSIADTAQEQGFPVLMRSSYFDVNRELELFGAFHRRRVSRTARVAHQRTYRSDFDFLTSAQQGLAATRPPPV
jgi:hypothetical protein